MRVTTDKMYYGNYRFVVEFDSGSEAGSNQLTVWVAEKADIDTVPLKRFVAAQLLSALGEPERSRLHTKLEEERRACQQPFELEIANLQEPFNAAGEKLGQKVSEKVKRRARNLREQMKSALQRLEVEFARRELWPLDRRWFDRNTLQAQSRVFGEEFPLRDFYFEEANGPHIRNFCRKFALDEGYRQQVLAGETRWARRNTLFVRNLLAVVGEDALLTSVQDYDRKARDFFRWVDAHVEEILALPAYQRLKEEDSAFEPSAGELDPLIRPAVQTLNRIPGVTTRFSCQGVSGKVRFGERELLVVSPHEEYAYVSFSELGQPTRNAIAALLPSFPGVTDAHIPCNFALGSVLRSSGDNLRFREELVELAERVLASVDSWDTCHSEGGSPMERSEAATVGSQDGPAPAGIPPSRLAWLCQPARIERTLRLLFFLNHWAKARERLLYADRQGLYRVKAVLVQQAFAAGLVSPVSYIDGSSSFAREFSLDPAADIAAEVFIDRLAILIEDDEYLPTDGEESDSAALRLFARITGRQPTSRVDIEALDVEATKDFLQEQLAALCIEPVDLLDIHWSRNRPAPRWSELDESEAVQLDPEGLSLIAFEYAGATAHYIFHLPFRTAERFLPEPLVRDFSSRPGDSQECGEFFGRTITEAESREHPVGEILRELGVDVAAVCPHRLTDKQEYVSQLARRYPYWDSGEEEDDDEEDRDVEDWEVPSRSESHLHKVERAPGTCPLCGGPVKPVPAPRIEHWRQNHRDHDLTASQVAWLFVKSKADVKSPSAAIQPDYRGPSSSQSLNGTRFWRLETLEIAVRQGQECGSES
jgi:hypothetical protein